MMNVSKYKKQYYLPPETCMDWAKKDYIDKAPAWCSVDLRDGNQALVIPMSLEQKLSLIHICQGHAHALNLKESGCDVIIGLYEGSRSWKRAEEQGFKVYTAAEAAKKADIIMILINDEKQADMYKKDIEPNLEEGNMPVSYTHLDVYKRQSSTRCHLPCVSVGTGSNVV